MISNLPISVILIAFAPSLLIVVIFIVWSKVIKKNANFKRPKDPLTLAQLDEIKNLTEANIQTQRFEGEIQKQFSKSVEDSKINLSKLEQDYAHFLDELKLKASNAQENNQSLIVSQINKLFENFEQNLANFLTQTQQQSVMSIDLELRSARTMIDTYKQQQLHLIDENIIAILERTLSLVLTKKLTLKDQIDLVYEALERAKTEKFIA